MTDRNNMILKVGVIFRDDSTDDKSTMLIKMVAIYDDAWYHTTTTG